MQINKISVKYVILLTSIIFIIIGVNAGEHNTIYNKAIRICLECIGIG